MKEDHRLNVQVQLIEEEYQFEIENAVGMYSIAFSTCPELASEKFLIQGNGPILRVKNPIPNKRLYFSIKDDKGCEERCATRLVDLSSIENFRDIGGYTTKEGKRVKM